MLFPDLHVIACFLKGSDDSLQRRGEFVLRGLCGEQVHVLGRAIDESVFTNGTRPSQREPCFRACRLQGNPRDPSLLGGIPAHVRTRSSGKRVSHRSRTLWSRLITGHSSMRRSRLSRRSCSATRPSVSNAW